MIKIFNANDRSFATNGNIIINPVKCTETKRKSLNGWYLDVEVPVKYASYIERDKLCVIQTKSKLNPQAFRIKDIEKGTRRIKFQAQHVMFDAADYFLLDVRPENRNGQETMQYINQRTDKPSPFNVFSNVENISTTYLIRKTLLEAWEIIEEKWHGVFDADNWEIRFLNEIGQDNGETLAYKNNLQGIKIYEDWSNVCTKICPVGNDGLLLPEVYIEADIQYDEPYTKKIDFQTKLEEEERNTENLISELRQNANAYIQENKYPKVCYEITSNVKQNLDIGDTVHVKHPLVNILSEVLEYEYDVVSKRVKKIIFGNYDRNIKNKINIMKDSFNSVTETLSKQENTIKQQTNLINMLNKTGYVYIDKNEIFILDKIPKEQAENVWRWGLGGLGFSSTGYEGPFTTAMTMDGKINADFITTGKLDVSVIQGLGTLSILASQLHLEGYTTINNGFSIDEDGNMTCNNATVKNATIKNGNIDMESDGMTPAIHIKSYNGDEIEVYPSNFWMTYYYQPSNGTVSHFFQKGGYYVQDDNTGEGSTVWCNKIETPEIWLTGTNKRVINSLNSSHNFGTDSNSSGMTTVLRGNTVRIYAHTQGAVYLGSSGTTAVTSDEKLKDIFDVDDKYIKFFNNLKPISYVYKKNGHRTHLGFGARQVEEALKKVGLTTEDFAGILIDKDVTISADEAGTDKDAHYDELYSLRYEEFISLNTYMIQNVIKENVKYQEEIDELKQRIGALEKIILKGELHCEENN